MKRTNDHSSARSQRGFSLAEVLTATAIFAVIFIAALMLYDRSNRVYKEGVQASDMQQTTRVAFDKLVADLRMTGFDFDRDGSPQSALASQWRTNAPYAIGNIVEPDPPNGHVYKCIQGGTSHATTAPTWDPATASMTAEAAPSVVRWQEIDLLTYQQPDEQIEYAGASVVTVRSNFDFDFELGDCIVPNTPCENGREKIYESNTFPVVTTGNDEIVTYALRPMNPPVGWNPTQLTFFADAGRPRRVDPSTNVKEDAINLPRVYDPCTGGCNAPPYSLYRITLQDRNGVAFTETPIAENIRSVNYRYFRDAAATDEILVLPDGAGQYDPAAAGATVAGRDTRAEIRSIRINLVGMNQQADPDFNDPTDAIAPRYRKYQLESLIVPRNIGRRGMKEFTTDAPQTPTLDIVCPGSCNATYLSWTAAGSGGEVDSYNILFDTDDCTSGFTYAEDAGRNLDGYASIIPWITPGQVYFFAVQAINRYGAVTSNCISARVENVTRPQPPTILEATGGALPAVADQITLQWPPATKNYLANSSTTCSNSSVRSVTDMPNAERRYYRVYKSKLSAVDPADPGTTLALNEYSATQPMFDGTNMVWSDPAVANCTKYYYRIATIDYCARNPLYNQGNDASLGVSTDYFPVISSPGVTGEAIDNANRPAQPQGFAISNTTCVGIICDLTFSWTPVSKKDGQPAGPNIYVENYTITVQEKILGVWVPSVTVPTTHNFANGVTTGTITGVPQSSEFAFYLSATDCNKGPDSTAVFFPCTFGGGTVTITAPVSYGGTGTSGDPWVTDAGATVRVQTTNPVAKVEARVSQGGSQVGTPFSQTGTLTDVSIPLPDVADGVLATVSIVVTDTSGSACTLLYERFVIDQPAPACALDNDQANSSIMTWSVASDEIVNLILKNDSADPIKILDVIVRWTPGNANNQAEDLETGSFTTGTTTVNCNKGTTIVSAPANTFVAGNTSAGVTLTFDRARFNKAINTNPVSSICIRYQASTGDILFCQIAPGPGTCVLPATACQ